MTLEGECGEVTLEGECAEVTLEGECGEVTLRIIPFSGPSAWVMACNWEGEEGGPNLGSMLSSLPACCEVQNVRHTTIMSASILWTLAKK